MGHSLYIIIPHEKEWLVSALRKHYKNSNEVLGFENHTHEQGPYTSKCLTNKNKTHNSLGIMIGFNYSVLNKPEYEYVWGVLSLLARKYGIRGNHKEAVPFLVHDGTTKWRVLEQHPANNAGKRTYLVVDPHGRIEHRKRSTRWLPTIKRTAYKVLAFLKEPLLYLRRDRITDTITAEIFNLCDVLDQEASKKHGVVDLSLENALPSNYFSTTHEGLLGYNTQASVVKNMLKLTKERIMANG